MSNTSLTFRAQFTCDNAAFENDMNHEIASILREIADSVESGGNFAQHKNIRDSNGNLIGTFALKPKCDF